MVMLNCCLNYFMMQIWSCLKVWCVAHTVFTSYFHHWSLSQWNSELLTVFLFSFIATITFTNIHLFYDVYLMEHTNCLCLLLLLLFTSIVCSIFHFNFSLFQLCRIHCMLFSVLLDGVWLSRIKRITYLLTYLFLGTNFGVRNNYAWCLQRC